MNLFLCHDCPSEPNLAPAAETAEGAPSCSRCGSTNGEAVTPERLDEGMASGAFYSKDAKGNRIPYKGKRTE